MKNLIVCSKISEIENVVTKKKYCITKSLESLKPIRFFKISEFILENSFEYSSTDTKDNTDLFILENFDSARKWIEDNCSSPNKHHLLFIIDEMEITKKIFFKIIKN